MESGHLTKIAAPAMSITPTSSHIMGHCYTTRVSTALVVLLILFVLDATALSTARSSLLARRGLLDSTETPRTIGLDLMHIHHVNSPFMQGEQNLTLMERIQLSLANDNRRHLQSKQVFTSPLASAQGNYIMQITLGTPARTFVAYADTGSDLVWVQCTCTKCLATPDAPFDPTASSSYSPLPCNSTFCPDLTFTELPCPSSNMCSFNYTYGDGTFTSGNLAYETVTFTGVDDSTIPVSDIAFGCGIDDASNTFTGTDGLVGLGQGPLSLPSQLAARSIIDHVFSYCLVDFNAAINQTSPLLLGSSGAAVKSYTPILTNIGVPFSTYYYVNLTGITVDGQPISYPAGLFDINSTTGEGGIIVDSGTSITYLYEEAYNALESAIAGLVTYQQVNGSAFGFELCYNTTDVPSPVFPTVVFQFENADVTLGLSNTFFGAQTVEGFGYCLAILPKPADLTNSIFGNMQQAHFEISFDVENKQVGFAPDVC